MLVGPDDAPKNVILQRMHNSLHGGHSGRDATLQRVKTLFYWNGLTTYVTKFVRNYVTCQVNKHETRAEPGLLQPLPILTEVWVDIFMDFITGLPKSLGKDVILVVVEKLKKYAHFIGLSHPYSATEVAQLYLAGLCVQIAWLAQNHSE